MENKVKGKKEIVFAITIHPFLGYIIETFAVGRTVKGLFEYDFKRLSFSKIYDYAEIINDDIKEIIKIVDLYSDENLYKRFNIHKVSTSDFFSSLEEDFIQKQIRPFIDKQIYKVVKMIKNHSIPLFYKGEQFSRIKETPIKQEEGYAEAEFVIRKLADKTQYNLEVRYEEETLNLYKQDTYLLSRKPCTLVLNNRLFRFDEVWDGKKLTPFFKKEYLDVPGKAEKEFYSKFLKKALYHHPCRNIGFEIKNTDNAPKPVLRIENHWQEYIALALYFQYDNNNFFHNGEPANASVSLKTIDGNFEFTRVLRKKDIEKDLQQFLKSMGLRKLEGPYWSVKESRLYEKSEGMAYELIYDTIQWINDHIDTLETKGFDIQTYYDEKAYYTGKQDLKLETETRNDWFDIYGTVKVRNFEFPFLKLKKNILAKQREYKLPDGSVFIIPQEWMTDYYNLIKLSENDSNGHLKIRKQYANYLKEFEFVNPEKIKEIKTPENVEKFELSPWFSGELRPYQYQGYNWMMYLKENNWGGCLADDMGLGKTIQTIAALAQNHLSTEILSLKKQPEKQLTLFDSEAEKATVEHTPIGTSLIIMPLSLIHNWINEINRFAPGLRILRFTGMNRPTDISAFNNYHLLLTTYGTVRNDMEILQKFHFDYIILDESQTIKNARSKIFKAIKQLKSKYRLVLTGTPIENSLKDLWSQFSFINPGLLMSMNAFTEQFVTPIEKQNNPHHSEKLQKIIQPFILRRTKSQVAKELPPLSEKIEYCEMTPEQAKTYETKKSEVRNAIFNSIEKGETVKPGLFILSGLTKLRIIANHPVINDADYKGDSGKYQEVIRNIEKVLSENHKVLIFSQFVKHLHLFRNYFEDKGLDYSLLTGGANEKSREKLIKQFKEDQNNRLFLISLKAGGLGLNLTDADYVFMLDPWWNPAVENQAINRAHRIGQTKNVFVYKYITRNTIEEKILRLQQKKTRLSGRLVRETSPMKSISLQELKELL